jgi:hypothetical protein
MNPELSGGKDCLCLAEKFMDEDGLFLKSFFG